MVITISDQPIRCVEDRYDLVVALDHETIEHSIPLMKDQGWMIMDDTLPLEKGDASLLSLFPMTNLAKETGSAIMKTSSALGVIGGLFRLDKERTASMVKDLHQSRPEHIQEQNRLIFTKAYDQAIEKLTDWSVSLPAIDSSSPMMHITGNEAISLGALMAGCRFLAAYPITPASEIMEWMGEQWVEEEGWMIQAEDEIAAIHLSIGAAYAGARSMTATSGPGISLMTEGIGLAGMTETPVVIVDSQRAGPSTGMPTKTEQSDVGMLYHAGHGEFPLILLTLSTTEECYTFTMDAFRMADEFQCPVVILSDLNLSLSPSVIPALEYREERPVRGLVLNEDQHPVTGQAFFSRYALTESGVSPRSFPGMPAGLHHTTGLEHTTKGFPTDKPHLRKEMMDKRNRKTKVLEDQDAIQLSGQKNQYLCLTFGSGWGVLEKALGDSNLPIDGARIGRIRPLPVAQLQRLFQRYEKVLVLEANQTGQLAGILRMELGFRDKIESDGKYSGQSFSPRELIETLEGWCQSWT